MPKDTKSIELNTRSIDPRLVRTYVYNLDESDWNPGKFEERTIFDYEFEYIIHSNGYMRLENKTYKTKAGDICFRRPGELTQGIRPYSCYLVAFKLTDNPAYHDVFIQNEIIGALPAVISVKNQRYFELLFKDILSEYLSNRETSSLKIKAMLLNIIYSLYEEIRSNYLPASPYYSIVNKAVKYIADNYQNKITLDDIAKAVGLSQFHFHKIFKQTMLITPNDYLVQQRLNHAKELLILTNDSVTDIAYKSGFESSSYFSYVFKQKLEISPKDYRKAHIIH